MGKMTVIIWKMLAKKSPSCYTVSANKKYNKKEDLSEIDFVCVFSVQILYHGEQ